MPPPKADLTNPRQTILYSKQQSHKRNDLSKEQHEKILKEHPPKKHKLTNKEVFVIKM